MSENTKNYNEKIEEKEKKLDNKELILKKGLEKYRINYLSFPNSQPKTDLKTLCPKCCEIPDIVLSKNSEEGHYVKCMRCRYCYCCSFPYSKTLDDYIALMAKMQQEKVKCEIHKDKGIDIDAIYSCEFCQKWMCEECINEHINMKEYENHEYYLLRKAFGDYKRHTMCPKHNLEYSYYLILDFAFAQNACESCNLHEDDDEMDIRVIQKEKGKCYFNQLKQIIKDGVDYLDIYCRNIYEHLNNSIKDKHDLIEKTKEIYDKFLIRNRRALFYFQMVINTGTPSYINYNQIGNISNSLVTKFEKINIDLTKKLSAEQIEKILNFFDQNYIIGINYEQLEDIKNLYKIHEFKELYTLNPEPYKKKEENQKDDENNKINIIDILNLNNKIIIGAADDGIVYLFEIDNKNLKGKYILSHKAHESAIISIDKIKDTNNKFVTCDERKIKIWSITKSNNSYTIKCETTLNDYSKSNFVYLYVLNYSNSISFINEENRVIILNTYLKPFFNVHFSTDSLTALYMIDSNDKNNSIFIIGGQANIILYKLLGNIELLGSLNIDCFSSKSLFYMGNDTLLVGGVNNIYIVNIKNIKLEQIIKMKSAECTCFLKFNDIVLCGYGDTSICGYWSGGIAQSKLTKFLIVKQNKEKLEYHFIEDAFNQYGITNALWIDKDKFVSCFYHDDCLKVFKIN